MDEDFEREVQWMSKRERYSFDRCCEMFKYETPECIRCELAYVSSMMVKLAKEAEDLKMTLKGFIQKERTN